MSLSNRQRKLVRKAQNVAQRRGRPLKAGARQKSGKLKPEKILPNEAVLIQRMARLPQDGSTPNFAAAESPLALAKHRGWLTPRQCAGGRWFALLCRTSGLDLPKLKPQQFERTPKGHDPRVGKAEDMDELRAIADGLRSWPRASQALVDVCVSENWPAWMDDLISGEPIRGEHLPARNSLVFGLNVAAEVLDAYRKRADTPKCNIAA